MWRGGIADVTTLIPVAEDGADLAPIGRLARAQDDGDRLVVRRLVDVDRQEVALVVVGVEKQQLLLANEKLYREYEDANRPIKPGSQDAPYTKGQ